MKLLHHFSPILCQKMFTCTKLFLQPPLTQCYFCQFYRNFDKLWIFHKKLDTGTGTPTDHTGSPEHRKNHLDEVQAGSGAVTHQGDICVFKCFAILYCMADDVLKQTMYWKSYKKLHNSLKWVREGCTIPVPVIVLYLYCTLYQ